MSFSKHFLFSFCFCSESPPGLFRQKQSLSPPTSTDWRCTMFVWIVCSPLPFVVSLLAFRRCVVLHSKISAQFILFNECKKSNSHNNYWEFSRSEEKNVNALKCTRWSSSVSRNCRRTQLDIYIVLGKRVEKWGEQTQNSKQEITCGLWKVENHLSWFSVGVRALLVLINFQQFRSLSHMKVKAL